MIPSKFKLANATLTAPLLRKDIMYVEEIGNLPIWTDGESCVSLWRMSFRERLSALLFGRVWLFVLSGRTQPPVSLYVAKETLEEKNNGRTK